MLFVVFPLLLLMLIFIFNFRPFDYCVSQCVPSWVHPAWNTLFFLDLVDYFLAHVREVFSYYVFRYFLGFFLSPSYPGTLIMLTLVCLMLSQRSLRFSSFFFILFSRFCSAAVISTILSSRKFFHPYASVILLLIPSSVLFMSVL